jgi:hypothetical protein
MKLYVWRHVVDASYGGSIQTKITHSLQVHTIFLKMIQMDMVVTLNIIIILIFEQYMFNHLQTFPNLCENLYLM